MTVQPGCRSEIVFGPFRLDLGGRKLCRDGKGVQLGTRSLDILCVLVESQGNLVTKDDLMAQVWRGLVVEENTIQVHVSALRKALGEGVSGQRYILTVPGQGYRFIGEAAQQQIAEMMPPDGASAPMLPDKPSIAVLPFQNMSGEPEQDYFADGVVEDITTALTRFPSLFVIARNSSFTYKDRAVDVRQVSRELGVRYLLEGSVRKAAKRIRITAQLIDATTGVHLWADHFDGDLTEIFDLQNEIAASVVGAMVPKLELAEIERVKCKPTENLHAYDYYLRGLASFHRQRREANADALQQFYKAIEFDPDFASAHGMAARCYVQRQNNGWMMDRVGEKSETARLAWRAAELGRDDAFTLCIAALALASVVQEVEAGAALIDRALDLNPNLAIAWSCSAWIRGWLGEPELAIEHAARGMRLSPVDPRLYVMEAATAHAHLLAGRYDTAVSWAERALRQQAYYQPTIRILAASHALAGRLEQAQTTMARMRGLDPELRISELMDFVPLRRPDDRARFFGALRKAGLPE
jgi:TolB-like protein/Tfp pilus assembly protein PilF